MRAGVRALFSQSRRPSSVSLPDCLPYLPYVGNWLAWFTEPLFRHASAGNRRVLMVRHVEPASVGSGVRGCSSRGEFGFTVTKEKRQAAQLWRLLHFWPNLKAASLVIFFFPEDSGLAYIVAQRWDKFDCPPLQETLRNMRHGSAQRSNTYPSYSWGKSLRFSNILWGETTNEIQRESLIIARHSFFDSIANSEEKRRTAWQKGQCAGRSRTKFTWPSTDMLGSLSSLRYVWK